jgi:hypothetical protein
MTHSPPVPPHNQSPYPLEEPPHLSVSKAEPDVSARTQDQTTDAPSRELSTKTLAAIGGALGFGAVAIFALKLVANRKTAAAQQS